MNFSIVAYLIGWILNFEAALMILPCITAVVYGESAGWFFVLTMALCLAIGLPLVIKGPKNRVFFVREGFATVALGWLVLSIMGALPFFFSGVIPSLEDALFETISGFTTTGASILSDVEALPKCMIFWRSFTHWIGGMGVLVFVLAVLPMTGGSSMSLMKAESPGPSVSKLMPRVQSTAKILYIIYIALTVLQIALLLFGRMPVFDAITTAFGTAGTGGFGIKNSSMTDYSPYIQVVTTIFMILFGVNFSMYFLLLNKKIRQALKFEEVRWYLGIILVAIIVIAFNIRGIYSSVGETLRHSSFQVASIITTTGFASTDFNSWNQVSKTILVMLMFVGACAGSTGGGIKVSRLLISMKTIKKELIQFIHPKSLRKVAMDGKPLEHEVVRSTNVFLIAYLLIFSFSVLFIAFDGHDLITNFTAVAATFNNIGPGLELVGPTGNFGMFSAGSKIVLMFDMLAGRLEIFPLLLLFLPETWKKF